MNKKIRVGIIGGGFGAKVHVPLMKSHPGFEVVAISSVSRGKIEDIKQETGLDHVYDNWQEMLEKEKLDLVSIVSAPLLHHDMVLKAFEHGCDVLCEKPMAANTDEAVSMIKAKDNAKKLAFINFEFRFLPARQKVKEIISSGQLGKIMHVNYTASFPGYERAVSNKRGWLSQEDQAGGMLGAIGSHMFDSLLWWMDDKVNTVKGQLATHVPLFVDENGEKEVRTADDSFQATGSFTSGTTFTVGLISVAQHSPGWRLEVYGTAGTLIMTEDKKVFVGISSEPVAEVEVEAELNAPEDMSEIAARYYQAFYPFLEQVYEAITNEQMNSDLPTFESGHQVQMLLDEIRKSHKEQ
ncbi:Gfo/Idh/MocA family oxidoreductase [Bacillaceae bacterium IKA-2]|nr:Gfo/Idh/MocA family oxidoreductase [Bacillaceae bacterium IKA-2]